MIRSKVNGEYNREKLNALKFPIAWSGTVDQATRAAEEAAIGALVDEAREALQADPDAIAVEIKDGEVVATIHEGE